MVWCGVGMELGLMSGRVVWCNDCVSCESGSFL